MWDSETAQKPKSYKFSWDFTRYDCCPPTVRSPIFRVHFDVTEWYMELDLSKLQNIESYIPSRLQRVPGIGPSEVTFDVTITVKLGGNKYFYWEKSHTARDFSEEGFWDFNIHIPPQKLESKEVGMDFLTSKKLLIGVEMKMSKKSDPEFPQNYWRTEASKSAVVNDLKKLRCTNFNPKYHDLVLKAPGKEFQLHKCILNARWPKLSSVLEIKKPSDVVETRELSDIPDDLLENLLNFAYYRDLDFMQDICDISNAAKLFDLVRKYNFFRLNDQLAQLAPECFYSQSFQYFVTSLQMEFTNVTSRETAMGDIRCCSIPHEDIKFMDLRVYIDKGPFGYNWLMFSVVLGKIPEENPVTVKCKLYVVDESNVEHLLTEQHLLFNKDTAISFSTPLSKGKTNVRYIKISEPVIKWEDLTYEQNGFLQTKSLSQGNSKRIKFFNPNENKEIWFNPGSGKPVEKNSILFNLESEKPIKMEDVYSNLEPQKPVEESDICFRFEIKLASEKSVCTKNLGESIFMYEGDKKIFQDLKLMCEDKFTDIELTSGTQRIKAHKAILAARSPTILKAIQEAQTNLKSLPIRIAPEHLQAFIHYLYTGHIQEVSFHNIDHLLTVAEEYKVKCLVDLLTKRRNESKAADLS